MGLRFAALAEGAAVILFAIDPGPEKSALVRFGGPFPFPWGIEPNEKILEELSPWPTDYTEDRYVLAIEMVQSFGMPVGKSVFETVRWIGRFEEAWGGKVQLIYRTTIKGHLCNSARAKDANVRQALIDRYPATGGGKVPQIGTKEQPGPLYGFKSHLWSALAVGVTAMEQGR